MVELGSTIPTATVSCPENVHGADARDRLHGPRGQRAQPLPDPARRQDRGLHRQAGQSGRRADHSSSRIGSATSPRCSCRSCVRAQRRSKRRTHRLLAQSPPCQVGNYFGSAPTFVLEQARSTWPPRTSSRLTVPTWAPVLAVGPAARHLVALVAAAQLRQRRPAGGPMTKRLTVKMFGCTYFRERPVLHGHLRAGPAPDQAHQPLELSRGTRPPWPVPEPGARPLLPRPAAGVAWRCEHRGLDLHGRLPGVRRGTAGAVAGLVLPPA